MNNPREFWQHLLDALRREERCVLLCVVESIGSSPGRTGFKMFVTSSGEMHGSIGGGSMEQKLVELARSLMELPERFPFLKQQVHRAEELRDRSGMICSGEQTVAFFLVGNAHVALCMDCMDAMDASAPHELVMSSTGMSIALTGSPSDDPAGTQKSDPEGTTWMYREPLNAQPRIAIVGGGHVGFALSRMMHQLGFLVHQFDDRAELNTMTSNTFAHQRSIINYHEIDKHLPDDPGLFVVLVSHGYRTDEKILRKLIRKKYKYIGMLGSEAKVMKLFAGLRADGFTKEEIARVHAPIGLPIHSRTPEEIAVSIAAEIIRMKNS